MISYGNILEAHSNVSHSEDKLNIMDDLSPKQAITSYKGNGGKFHSFLTLALDEDE